MQLLTSFIVACVRVVGTSEDATSRASLFYTRLEKSWPTIRHHHRVKSRNVCGCASAQCSAHCARVCIKMGICGQQTAKKKKGKKPLFVCVCVCVRRKVKNVNTLVTRTMAIGGRSDAAAPAAASQIKSLSLLFSSFFLSFFLSFFFASWLLWWQ